MRKAVVVVGIALVASMQPALAQKPGVTGGAVVASEPGKAAAVSTVQLTATVVAVDKATRTLTLKGPHRTVDVVASDEVKNFDQIKVGDRWMNSRAYTAGFNFKGSDQQQKVGKLSGGERNRLHLAKLLRSGGNLLLLDEPTNDLDVETLGSLENALLEFPGCAVVISHDRWFLDRVATHILAWEGDEENPAAWFWFEGNFESYEKNKVERLGLEKARPHRVTYRKLGRD